MHTVSLAAAADRKPAHDDGTSADSTPQRSQLETGPDRSCPSADQARDRHELAPDDTADRSVAVPQNRMTVRPWPLLILAAPAAVAVWSGWVGIGQMTGFGKIQLLPGIWNSPAPRHRRHPADRRRGLRGVRAARLAHQQSGRQRQDAPVRPLVRHFLTSPRHGRAGGLPPARPGRGNEGAVGGHHAGVLSAGPGPRHGVRPGTPDTQRRFGISCGCRVPGRGGWRPGNDQAMLAGSPGAGPAGTEHMHSFYSARVRRQPDSGRALRRRRCHGRASVVSRAQDSRAPTGQKEAFGCLRSRCEGHRIRSASVTPVTALGWTARFERGSWHARASG